MSHEGRYEHNRQLAPSVGHAALSIGSEHWDLFIFGVTRVGSDAFIQLTLLGPRECTVTVRAPSAMVQGVTKRQILDVVCDWLLSGDVKPHMYLELPAERRTHRQGGAVGVLASDVHAAPTDLD
jgi:hypothetical protein